ncbi:MAG: 2-oxoglutarate dehydrogenase E1 component [Pseudomonadota bacterium]|nr:2-oxoglutarate dehydrogenase E1 component [Pseudomonadota bacterium]
MQEIETSSYLFGLNATYIEDQYEAWLADPHSVNESWRDYFSSLGPGRQPDIGHTSIRHNLVDLAHHLSEKQVMPDLASLVRKQVAITQLVNAYRYRGFQVAHLDPLGRCLSSVTLPELDLAYYGFTEADMDTVFNSGSLVGPQTLSLRDIYRNLRQVYCGSLGVEYMHIASHEQKHWLQERLEGGDHPFVLNGEGKQRILERLTAAETLELYLHTRYVGQKRFSLQGSESLIVLLDSLIERAGQAQVQELFFGMAHRGRLNVLVNVFGKKPSDLFKEFEGIQAEDLPAGDVKYHQGFSTYISGPEGPIHLCILFNPSHLEIGGPVVEGSVRARQQEQNDLGGDAVIPVLIHGDASFAGQGVVMEMLNMSQTRGYATGGSIHVVINNQIGFTTSDPRDARSSLYCTDVAKMVDSPVFHVNGDDPEAVVAATQMAFDFRMRFHKDVVLDLVCYRKLGHNEADDPSVTQPMMYRAIAENPGVRTLYARKLEQEGILSAEAARQFVTHYRKALDEGNPVNSQVLLADRGVPQAKEHVYNQGLEDETVSTGVDPDDLSIWGKALTRIPEGFSLHPIVEKVMAERLMMAKGQLPVDWGFAETLAYASLLMNGYPVRLSGQDSSRGTFFHRHAMLRDQFHERWDQGVYIPLEHLKKGQPSFIVIDSLLSEEAVLAFEYGYSVTNPEELVIWEAQYGDFANGAQVVIDQFISSGEAKWGQISNLVMMLPHGYEGQGPEHSSARIERYLQLCVNNNMQVCIPSLPSQVFHLLRRQVLRSWRKPLVMIMPKSLLRSKQSVSSLDDLALGCFSAVLTTPADSDAARVLFCSGKIYFELAQAIKARPHPSVALVRIEQLYPFPVKELQEAIALLAGAKQWLWVQEEPENQGVWDYVVRRLPPLLPEGAQLGVIAREAASAPAVGYVAKHKRQQQNLIAAALGENDAR